MKFLCLTDYHGASEYSSAIPSLLAKEDPDCIFYCGGSMKGTKRLQEYEAARRFYSKPDQESPGLQEEVAQDMEHFQQFHLALADTQKVAYVIPGLSDAPDSFYFKTVYNYSNIYPNLRPVHEMVYREDNFLVTGFGGEISPSEDNRQLIHQYSHAYVEFAMRRIEYFPGEKILLFHSPPVCRLDRTEDEHCGVLLINELIEKISPQLVLCGRAKSGQGWVKLGNSVVVNPGPFYDGHYALIEYPSMQVQFKNIKNL